ncbi:Elongation of fatty acids protein 2 [Serendipita sp. 398]|nr:Elongation of fatty acids protein 2 [Serendipita sp. 398]
MGDLGQIIPLELDIRNHEQIAEAVRHSDIVYNLIGRDYETKNFDFASVNKTGAADIARISAENGVPRLVHVSHINASHDSSSKFYRTKAEGEEAVKAAFPHAIIARPSQMYGMEDKFLNSMAYWPMLWKFNKGKTVTRPVHVQDVAQALANVAGLPELDGSTLQLSGPITFSYKELEQLVSLFTFNPVSTLPEVPKSIALFLSRLSQRVWWPTLSPDEIERRFISVPDHDSSQDWASVAMGIKGLTALIQEHAPKAIKEHDIKTLFGRKVAIDASMSIYQFLIAVRQRDGETLQNDQGETTSHLMGFFYRTIRMMENGIKPCYVFDGKPPELKSGVLAKRFERREEAKEEGEEAKEVGTTEDVDKFSRRQVRVTREHNEECRKLLGLMGIPVVVAPGEAEAQCAELARGGQVYAAGSEDMDTLTFNTPILLRHLTFSEARKEPILEVTLPAVLEGLEMDLSQFIELCILLGCDYLEPIRGVGPKSALKLLREHGSLSEVVEHLRERQAANEEAQEEGKKKKGGVHVPEDWPWEKAKELFLKPDVTPADSFQLDWKEPDVEGLVEFLVKDKGFNEERVRRGAEKLTKHMNAKQQGRLDGFFKVVPKSSPQKEEQATKGKGKATKRKAGDEPAGPSRKTKRR